MREVSIGQAEVVGWAKEADEAFTGKRLA